MILTCTACGASGIVKRFQRITPFCWKHYLQMRRHGRTLARTKFDPNEFIDHGEFVEIILYQGNGEVEAVASTFVDRSQWPGVRQHKWHVAKRAKGGTKYAESIIDGRNTLLHHFIVGKRDGLEVDHVDGNGLNNRKNNLQFLTHRENVQKYFVSRRTHSI